MAGVLTSARAAEMDVHLLTTDRSEGTAAALKRLAAEDRADGFILMTTLPLMPADTRPLDDAGVPYVLANRHFGPHPVNCVTYDWEAATHDALRRLYQLGHRRMALLLPNTKNTTVAGHETGWLEGRAVHGVSPQDAPVVRYRRNQPGDQESGRALAETLLTRGLPGTGHLPTALVGFNDWCALGVLRGAAAVGVAVPEMLSVIGFDNTLLGEASTPQLSSYNPQAFEMGERAAELLGALLRKKVSEPARVMVPVDFVKRASCGPAPLPSH